MNKTVMITGASGGLGRALSYVFAKNGYNLILHGRDLMALEDLRKKLIKAHEVICDIAPGDITIDYTIALLADIAKKRDVDILINNAAMYVNREFACLSSAMVRKMINTNLIAPMLLTKKLFELFQRKQSGLIVNINSSAGKAGGDGETAYCAGKHGLSGFSKALQFDATRHNIRVIDVYLGAMKTGMTLGRDGREKFSDPNEVAGLIFKTCEDYPSLRITEIDISRRNY